MILDKIFNKVLFPDPFVPIIPIISFDCPSGPSEIILHGVNGFLVPYLDNTDFAQRILGTTCENIFDPKKVIETSNRFHIDKIINKYERLVINRK